MTEAIGICKLGEVLHRKLGAVVTANHLRVAIAGEDTLDSCDDCWDCRGMQAEDLWKLRSVVDQEHIVLVVQVKKV